MHSIAAVSSCGQQLTPFEDHGNNILDVEAMMCGHEIQLEFRHCQPLASKANSTREQLTIAITTNEMLPGPPIRAVKDHALI